MTFAKGAKEIRERTVFQQMVQKHLGPIGTHHTQNLTHMVEDRNVKHTKTKLSEKNMVPWALEIS